MMGLSGILGNRQFKAGMDILGRLGNGMAAGGGDVPRYRPMGQDNGQDGGLLAGLRGIRTDINTFRKPMNNTGPNVALPNFKFAQGNPV